MIEFDEQKHIYTVDGIETVSVTRIVSQIFPRKYEGVSEEVLKKAADYGTSVHTALQNYIENRSDDYKYDLLLNGINYDVLEKENCIEPVSLEEMVAYVGDVPLYAGRYDMFANVNGKKTIIDFKTTSRCDGDMLSWQLSMYAIAYEQMNKEKIDELACIWLPRNKVGSYVSVKRLGDEEVLEKVKEVLGL